jgi:UDP-glucose 4-epimerase
MKVLVTGGLGVNGCWVTRQLLEMGHHPIVLDNRPDFSLLPDIATSVQLVQADVRDFDTILRTLRENRVERVCHLAGLYPRACDADPLVGFQTNALSTVQILEAARLAGVQRVVYTSSVAAISPISADYLHPERKAVTEDYPVFPRASGVYSATKVASELMGLNYQRLFGLQFVALRFATTYGPGKLAPRHGNINIVWQRIVENAMRGAPTRLQQDGNVTYDMTYTRDVGNSVVLACFAENPVHSVFHVGSGRGYTLQEFGDRVKQVIPTAVIEVGVGQGGSAAGGSYLLDISLARKELGYEPQYDPATATKDWLHWLERLNLPVASQVCA